MELAKVLSIIKGDQGADLSHYQAVSDWKAFASKVKFVYIKATEGSAAGSAYVDPKMDSHFQGAKSQGLLRGFYHFARYVSVADAIEEAKWFVQHIKGYDFNLPPVLDLEYHGCKSNTELAQATKAFLDYVEQQLGSAIIYFSKEYYNYVKGSIGNYAMWLAYPSSTLPSGFTLDNLYAWQNNWHGAVTGLAGEVDLDLAGGKFFTVTNKAIPAPAPKPVVAPKPVASKPVVAPKPVASKPVVAPKPVAPKVTPKPVAPKPVAPATYTNYTIKSGDTLSGIAAAHGTTVAVLQSLNGIKDASTIFAGEVIKIPAHGGAVAAAPKAVPATYKIQPGDSLGKIAAKFGVSERTLQKLNGISNPNNIIAGHNLRLR